MFDASILSTDRDRNQCPNSGDDDDDGERIGPHIRLLVVLSSLLLVSALWWELFDSVLMWMRISLRFRMSFLR